MEMLRASAAGMAQAANLPTDDFLRFFLAGLDHIKDSPEALNSALAWPWPRNLPPLEINAADVMQISLQDYQAVCEMIEKMRRDMM